MSNQTITVGTSDYAVVPGCYIDGHRGQYALGAMVELADDILGTSFTSEYPKDEDGNLAGTYGENGPWDIGNDHTETCVWVGERAEAALNAVTEGGYWTWEDGEFFLIADDEDSYFCGDCDGEFDDPVAAELCCGADSDVFVPAAPCCEGAGR